MGLYAVFNFDFKGPKLFVFVVRHINITKMWKHSRFLQRLLFKLDLKVTPDQGLQSLKTAIFGTNSFGLFL